MTSTEVLNFSTHALGTDVSEVKCTDLLQSLFVSESISYQFIYFARPISTVVHNTITLMILVKSQRLYKQHAVASIYLI